MTDRVRILIGRSMAGMAISFAVFGLAWLLLMGAGSLLWDDWVIHNGVVAFGSGLIAWLVVGNQPRNGEIWVFAWAGISTGLVCLLYAIAYFMTLRSGVSTDLLELVPAELPLPLALVMMHVNWLWLPLLLPFSLGLLLFPDGKPPSPRWRWVAFLTVGLVILTSFGLAWEARPSGTFTYYETQDTHGGFRSLTASLVTVGYPASFAMVLLSAAGLVVRFRRSRGPERQQFRWVVWGAAMSALFLLSALASDELGGRLDLALLFGLFGMSTFLLALGVAITKYRLYDIDVVISRTFVYGSLGALITLLYVGIVVGVSSLLGSSGDASPALSVAAIALVAIVAQPIRRRLQVVADRIVYGRRATPYQVLSDLARNVAAADETLLEEVARSLVDGTSGERSTIWVAGDGAMHPAATWPTGSPAEPGLGLTAQVTHDGEVLGAIAVAYPINGEPTPNDQHLIDQVAAGIGLALRNIQLTDDLKRRVEDLRESRRRIVAVQDDTRRKLERDLHDGAQQHLVALKVKLGLAANLAKSKDLDKTSTLIAAMSGEADEAIGSMRDFARGIYPPLLEAEGLSAAISAQARKLPLPVEFEADGIGRYSTEIESTIYFCVLESLQNAVKHSQAGQVRVRLEDHGDTIGFSVIDDGVGMTAMAQGTGLINLSDRVDSVGGDLRVESAPGRGVTVLAVIPKETVDA